MCYVLRLIKQIVCFDFEKNKVVYMIWQLRQKWQQCFAFLQPKSAGEVIVDLKQILVHPNFNVVALEFDFAILKVEDYRSFTKLSSTVGMACLPIGLNFTNQLAQKA